MRTLLIILMGVIVCSCDRERLYEKNHDFENREWLSVDQPVFDFEIPDTTARYNLYGNIRNSVEYPFSRIFINYTLRDSGAATVSKAMISAFLFEEKTGKPVGSSGLGDVYDQQIPILKNYRFKTSGLHSVSFEQFMRTDTLRGILAVGFRLEAAVTE